MIAALLIALLVAKIKKYKLALLLKEWTTYLVLVFALIYLYINFATSQGNTAFIKYASVFKAAFAVVFAILILKYSLYKSGFLSVAFIAVGSILNSIVMKANGGRMPVFPSLSYITGYMRPETFADLGKYDSVHIQGSSTTKLAFLGDWIDLGYSILSIGDVFFMSFVFLISYNTIKHLNRCCSTNIDAVKNLPQ